MQDENNTEKTEAELSPKAPATLSEKISNFWYHYKWHTLVALFIIFTITICAVQMSQRKSYDTYVLYAGSHEINRKSDTGGTTEYQDFLSTLSRVTPDLDSDGTSSVNLRDLFLLTNDEIKNLQLEDGKEINYPLIKENQELFMQTITVSEYYVCFLSTALYDEYKSIDGVEVFVPLSHLVNDGTQVEYYTDSAIYLNSTGFATMPGFKNLPEDTVICLRNKSLVSLHLNKKQTEKHFKRAEETVKAILNAEPIA